MDTTTTTTTELPNTLMKTGEEISPPHEEIIQKRTDDSGCRTLDVDCIDSSTNNPPKISDNVEVITKVNSTNEFGLTPKFRVEGDGGGDSSVSVTISGGDNSSITINQSESIVAEVIITNGENNIHSSLSRQNSEEMPLSLVSWYSEPGDTNFMLRTCCMNSSNSESIGVASSSTIIGGGKIDGSSEEKENKTPPPNSNKEAKSNTPSINKSKAQSVKMGDSNQRKGRLDKNSNLDETERQRSRSVGNRAGNCIGTVETHDKIECPRCSRKSKSGTGTPAILSRTPKRQIPSNKKKSLNLKKPIKSILKMDSRGSSGSDKQSSMDSLGSSTGGSPGLMTRSADSGPRAKFFHQENPVSQINGFPISALKRVDRYATIRIRKPRLNETIINDESVRRKLSYENVYSTNSDSIPPDIMTKSMSYLEKANENETLQNTSSGSMPGLKRHGSLRGRKPTPGWEPCTTRTTALRLLKLQENKAKSGGGSVEKSGSYPHSTGSGDSFSSPPIIYSHQVRSSNSDKKSSSFPKVFSKLSSVLGQTASSSQKRIKQERGVQTDSIFLVEGSAALANCRSPTPISPIPISEDIPDSMTQTEEIKHLQLLVRRYKAKAIKYQHIYDAAEVEKIEIENHLREVKEESKEMINFLQDEKTFLAESLTEAETEITKLKDEIEVMKKESESRCSSLIRLSEQHKQEAMKSHALLKRLETDSSSNIGLKNKQLFEGVQEINRMRQRIFTCSDVLLKKYKVSQELLNSALAAADGSNSENVKILEESMIQGSLLLPLIKILSSTFDMSNTHQTSSSDSNIVNSNNSTNGDLLESSTSVLESCENNIPHGSLENLKQAIKEREAAEKSLSNPIFEDYPVCLSVEINDLQEALRRFGAVVQSVVVQCDRKVSNITTNILEVLKSAESEMIVPSGGGPSSTSV